MYGDVDSESGGGDGHSLGRRGGGDYEGGTDEGELLTSKMMAAKVVIGINVRRFLFRDVRALF